MAALLLILGARGTSVSSQAATSAVLDGKYQTAVSEAKQAMLVDPPAALMHAREAERYGSQISQEQRRSVAMTTARWLQGEAYLRTNDPDRAEAPIASAIAGVIKRQPKSELHADILLSMGWLDSNRGKVGSSLNEYQEAFSIYQKLANARGQARALVFIALLYAQAMDQDAAIRYYQQALDVYKSDLNMSVSIYNNLGMAYAESKRFVQARNKLKQALIKANELNSQNLLEQIYINLARVELEIGNLQLADRAVAMGRKVADAKDIGLQSRLLATAAQSALQKGKVETARHIVISALVGINPALTDTSYRDVHQTAYDVFLAAGDKQAALTHLQSLKRLDDNATKLATSTQTALMAARFDFANQELKISQLRAQELRRGIAAERARAQTQRYIFLESAGAVAIVIAALAFGLVTLRRSRDRIRAANDDLAITNDALGKALAAKTEFLATTSHEIRTPLNGILGMTQVMLADTTLAADLRGRLDVVHDAGVTMRALVDDILDVAKMEAGNLAIEAAPFDVCATVTDAARMWEEQARAKGLSFEVTLEGCPAMIVGDSARMRQIVFNLLSNALKFTRSGRVALAVHVGDDDRLYVAVSDSGIGIPADKFEEIFESFRQADAGTTRQFGGTGLGLSICRNLARAMGGDVVVESVLGEGATFTLTLPLVRAAPVESAAVLDEGAAVTLVLDRSPITRSMFKTLLTPHFGPVLCVVSVDDAVARLAAGNVARMLIDDGTIRAAGDHHAALAQIVALAHRGAVETSLLWPVTSDSEYAELLATGVTRVIARPVSGGALIAAMGTGSVAKKHSVLDLVPRAA